MLTHCDDKRLREAIARGDATDGRRFAHWFGSAFVTLSKTKATLYVSPTYDARNARRIMAVSRDAMGYVAIADFIDAMPS